MESIERFLSINSGYGSGDGSGGGSAYGDGSGDGYGDGYGSGYGYGYSSIFGDGSGSGSGSDYGSGDGSGGGSGYGSGDGNSSGDGSGSGDNYGSGGGYGSGDGGGYGYSDSDGYGYGDGYNLKKYNGHVLHNVDGLQTVILHVRGNIAMGFTVNNDLSISKCFIVKQNNIFAHGKNLKKAQEALMNKLFKDMDEEDRIEAFNLEFRHSDIKYPAMKFFDWHNKLTGSCLFGRERWVKDRNIDIKTAMYTVEEFVELTKESYGGDIIKRILC